MIAASNSGLDTHPAWFHNLKSHPQVALQIADRQFTAIAEPAEQKRRQELWDTLVKRAPGYAAYQKRTDRLIPLVILQPALPA